MTDNVNHPAHYEKNSICINFEPYDWLQGFSFGLGNALKYLVRYKDKGHPKEDLQKAKWYLEHLDNAQCHDNVTPAFKVLFNTLRDTYDWFQVLYPESDGDISYVDKENIEALIDYIDNEIVRMEEPVKEDKAYWLNKVQEGVNKAYYECKGLMNKLKDISKKLDINKDYVNNGSKSEKLIEEYMLRTKANLDHLKNDNSAEPDDDLSLHISLLLNCLAHVFYAVQESGAIKVLKKDEYDTSYVEDFDLEELGKELLGYMQKAYPNKNLVNV